MAIVLKFLHRIPADSKREVVRLCEAFQRISPVPHRVTVEVVRHVCLAGRSGEYGFGVCIGYEPARPRSRVRIVIAAGLADEMVRDGRKRSEGIRELGHTLLHELAHYEQFRDSRTMIERGVNVRAASLYRKIDALKK